MGLKNFKQSYRETTVTYTLNYDLYGKGWGKSFDCDKDGNVLDVEIMKRDRPLAYDAYLECINQTEIKPYVQEHKHSYRHPAEGECECGRTVQLDNTDPNWAWQGNDCECGRIYNLSGQELRPRSEWEERIDDDY